MTNSQPTAPIMDHTPMVNIAPFGLCMNFGNPVSATRKIDALLIVYGDAWVAERASLSEAGRLDVEGYTNLLNCSTDRRACLRI
jgi:hypothetical protein